MWRHFRPHSVAEPSATIAVPQSGGVFPEAEALTTQLVATHRSLDDAIDTLKQRVAQSPDPARLLSLLVMQTPRAARAQEQMDQHPHGYHDKKARLFYLIDFNDTFVTTVLSLSVDERRGFVERLHHAMAVFCKQQRTSMFSDEQFEAIVHGLSREIAVFAAAQREQFDVVMANRVDDAFGVDMQIRDRQSRRYLNIDCKTRSSFFFRLKTLRREGRLSEAEAIQAENKGYCQVINRHDNRQVPVTLLRIDHVELGDVTDFAFADTAPLASVLHHVINELGQNDDGFGRLIS